MIFPPLTEVLLPSGGLTLQRVKDGEQVHEGKADGPPGKQSEAPRHPQEEGQADDAPQVPQHLSQFSINANIS